jgi:hypothetical protein
VCIGERFGGQHGEHHPERFSVGECCVVPLGF